MIDAHIGSQGELEFGPRFSPRFLQKHSGVIMTDPKIALIELVSNSWDANATDVDVLWPYPGSEGRFSISDNGHGMTAQQVINRWGQFWYDRIEEQGPMAENPRGAELPPRKAFGRNGKGRWAVFCFSEKCILQTWRDGIESVFHIMLGEDEPFTILPVEERERSGHGTMITGLDTRNIMLSEDEIRVEIGLHFLANPYFNVSINEKQVVLNDIPDEHLKREEILIPEYGTAEIIVLDSKRTDRTSLQHGISWHVGGKQVGQCNWDWFGQLIGLNMDRRTIEAKRYTIVIKADYLLDSGAVNSEWSGFIPNNPAWDATREAVGKRIDEWFSSITEDEKNTRRILVRQRYRDERTKMHVLGRNRWERFLSEVLVKCPRMREEDLMQVAGILATLEVSHHKYEMLHLLNLETLEGLDCLTEVLREWNAETAQIVLSELQERLALLGKLKSTLHDPQADELHDIQPLFQRGLWIFGPEFESIHYTSNKGMTTVLNKLFGIETKGSLNRPDFVILPNSNLGVYSLPSYDKQGGEIGTDRVVLVELKAHDAVIGEKDKGQVWRYVKELAKKGSIIPDKTNVRCFVLGPALQQLEAEERIEWSGNVVISPMSYSTFIARAESRTYALYEKIREAPFLEELLPTSIEDGEQPSLLSQCVDDGVSTSTL